MIRRAAVGLDVTGPLYGLRWTALLAGRAAPTRHRHRPRRRRAERHHGRMEYPELAARTRRFTYGAPRAVTVGADGARVAFLRSGGPEDPIDRLYVFDVATGDGTADRRPDRAARRARRRSCRRPSGRCASAPGCPRRHRLVRHRPERDRRRVHARRPPVTGPTCAPAGARRARGGRRRARSATRTRPASGSRTCRPRRRRRAAGHQRDRRRHADRRRGRHRRGGWPSSSPPRSSAGSAATGGRRTARRCWPPGSTRPGSTAGTWPTRPTRARPPRTIAYPHAGSPNAEVSLHLLDLDGGWVDVHWDRETYPYVVAVSWTETGGPLITVLRRLQQHGLVLAVDPAHRRDPGARRARRSALGRADRRHPDLPPRRSGARRRRAGPRRVRRAVPVRRRHPGQPAVGSTCGGSAAGWRRSAGRGVRRASRASSTCSGSTRAPARPASTSPG